MFGFVGKPAIFRLIVLIEVAIKVLSLISTHSLVSEFDFHVRCVTIKILTEDTRAAKSKCSS